MQGQTRLGDFLRLCLLLASAGGGRGVREDPRLGLAQRLVVGWQRGIVVRGTARKANSMSAVWQPLCSRRGRPAASNKKVNMELALTRKTRLYT